eukprot:1149971-Pelagomonas_calceolata.AAC.1
MATRHTLHEQLRGSYMVHTGKLMQTSLVAASQSHTHSSMRCGGGSASQTKAAEATKPLEPPPFPPYPHTSRWI